MIREFVFEYKNSRVKKNRGYEKNPLRAFKQEINKLAKQNYSIAKDIVSRKNSDMYIEFLFNSKNSEKKLSVTEARKYARGQVIKMSGYEAEQFAMTLREENPTVYKGRNWKKLASEIRKKDWQEIKESYKDEMSGFYTRMKKQGFSSTEAGQFVSEYFYGSL